MSVPLGLLFGGACVAILAALFHHYVVRMAKAREWLSEGAILVDVDKTAEFAAHHPRVAVNIPLEDLERRAHELGAKSTRIVVFGHSWRRGAQAVRALHGAGFGEIMSAAGLSTKEKLSVEAWRAAEGREARAAKARGVPAAVELAPRQP